MLPSVFGCMGVCVDGAEDMTYKTDPNSTSKASVLLGNVNIPLILFYYYLESVLGEGLSTLLSKVARYI